MIDRPRRSAGHAAPPRRGPLRAVLVALTVVVCGAAVVLGASGSSGASPVAVAPSGPTGSGGTSGAAASYAAHPIGSCVGANAFTAPLWRCSWTSTGAYTPTAAAAVYDQSDVYPATSHGPDCFAHQPAFVLATCVRGVTSGHIRVALIGNSHAGHWVPALEAVAERNNWRINTYLASGCAAADIRQRFATTAATDSCTRWVEAATRAVVAGHYNLVVMSNKVSAGAVGHDLAGSYSVYAQGYLKVLTAFHRAHLRVVALRDMPSPGRAPGAEKVPACLAAHPGNYAACNGTRVAWLPREPVYGAVHTLQDRHISYLDLTGRICLSSVCPAVVGGIVAYYDGSHMTATYNRTIAPYLAPHLRYALSRA